MSSNRLHSILRKQGGACGDGAEQFRGLTMKAAFKRATFSQLRWYVRNVLQDHDIGTSAWNLYFGYVNGSLVKVPTQKRKAIRILRDRIRRAHPHLRNA